jgi:hypothetical protein
LCHGKRKKNIGNGRLAYRSIAVAHPRDHLHPSHTIFCLLATSTNLQLQSTDIMDKDLKAARNGRWQKAFSEQVNEEKDPRVTINRKATIVIEHLMQASDVSHTMQVSKPVLLIKLALNARVAGLPSYSLLSCVLKSISTALAHLSKVE